MLRTWALRHNAVLTFLITAVVFTSVIGVRRYSTSPNILTIATCAALYAALATSLKVAPILRQVLATLGLATVAAGMVFLSDGMLVSHLAFALALSLVTLYQELYTYLILVLYMLVFYTLFAYLHPLTIFNASEVGNNTLFWSIIVMLLSIIFSLPALISAYFSTNSLRSESNLQSALAEAALRERQAVEIHDNVVQGLVVALYSLEAGDSESAKDSINTTLSSAKHIVDGLLQGGAVNTLRDTPASGDDAKN